MKKIFVCVLLLMTAFVNAQRQADNSVALENNLKEVYFNAFSGIPVVQSNKELIGVDPYQGKVIWKQPMGSLGSLSTLNGEGDAVVNNINNTPFIILENKTLLDTRNGNVLLKGNKIEGFQLLPEIFSVLVATKGEKGEKTFSMIDMKSSKVKWSSPVKVKTSLLDKAMALGSTEGTPESFRNLIHTKNNKIALMYGKSIMILDGNNGNVILNDNIKTGMLFTDSNEKNLFVVEGSPGLVAELRSFDDSVIVFDFNTGKEIEKIKLEDKFGWYNDIDGQIFIKSKADGMMYDYSGKEVWKRRFDEKRIYKIEKDPQGYVVFYKNEKMLVDKQGKKVWKKAEKVALNFEDDDYDWLEEDGYTKYEYKAGTIYVTSNVLRYFDNKDKTKNIKKTLSYKTNLTSFDEETKSLLVIECGVGSEALFFFNPDKGLLPKTGQSISIKKPGFLNIFEKTATGFFVSSPWEFIVLDDKGKIVTQKYYSTPGETGRKLLNVASGILDTAGAVSEVEGITNMVGGTPEALGNSMGVPGATTDQADKGVKQFNRGEYYTEAADMLYNPNRLNAFTQTNDYAFFFTKDKTGNKFLVQVEKKSGKELDKLKFESNTPKYVVDEVEKRVFYINKNNLDIFLIK
ncbi:hypothetical protein [Flavobacterium sangjuense]|uniref:Outer membrane protein assembly factor BamB n=1 Tax=Flavobacterium sangjuense TaxID=2518177 RepID=A0A4P7PS48_9FLAO|nr:hypothetical protein [Flavobacterium sangjuense]QBZ96962.1 hypothetical protein GS03_00447 [Flavobacterium sangjuense]